MQMRHEVAETGEIDLVWMHDHSHRRFDGMHHGEQMSAFRHRQIAHLGDMGAPDDTTEAGKSLAFRTTDTDDAAELILPEEFSAG